MKELQMESDKSGKMYAIISEQANSAESVISLPNIEYEGGATHTIPVYTRQAQINEQPRVQSSSSQTLNRPQPATITTENGNDEVLTCLSALFTHNEIVDSKSPHINIIVPPETDSDSYEEIKTANHDIPEVHFDKDTLEKLQNEDDTFGSMIRYINDKQIPQDRKRAYEILSTASSFYVENGLLYRLEMIPGRNDPQLRTLVQLCLPTAFIGVILSHFHDSIWGCHMGIA